ncbi:MBL fold metallo-hydrolase [Pyxidicoccus sp. 3LG]
MSHRSALPPLAKRLLVAAGAVLLLAASPAPPPPAELTYLGNEGVLIRVGGQQVAVDALHREFPRPPHYEHLPEEHREKLETARPPFDGIRVHLTTHIHADHFHADSVGRFLESSRGMDLVVPREAPAEVCRERPPEKCAASPRLHAMKKGWGREKVFTFGDVRVTVLDLPHAKGARTMVDNLGYIIEMEGRRFLHVGDAHMDRETFERFRLPRRKIDYALLPYWYLLDEDGRKLVREHIGAKHVVAFHVPPSEHASAAMEIHQHLPDALVLTRMMETLRLP